jgi:hypothetical protein
VCIASKSPVVTNCSSSTLSLFVLGNQPRFISACHLLFDVDIESIFSFLFFFMSSSDVDCVAGRTSPFLSSSRGGALSPLPSTSLTEEHIAEALANSPDNGGTLDFTHKGLTDVGEDGAEHLATVGRNDCLTEESSITRCALLPRRADGPQAEPCPRFRIALGYNRLATLPTAFALVSRLRYLNLKNNNFSVFPHIVCPARFMFTPART